MALAAQAELARRTATERKTKAVTLYGESRALRGRMRRQAALMRRLMGERRELQAQFRGPVELLDSALAEPPAYGSAEPREVNVQLPRNRSCGAVARRVLEDQLNGQFEPQGFDDAMLVTSELVGRTDACLGGIDTDRPTR